ncbi:MAG: hypothetical protein D6731_08280, partial [Planctomycetota bacterium]
MNRTALLLGLACLAFASPALAQSRPGAGSNATGAPTPISGGRIGSKDLDLPMAPATFQAPENQAPPTPIEP